MIIVEEGLYSCDAGSLKIGNNGFSVLLDNGVGDGTFSWTVGEGIYGSFNSGLFVACLQGKNLYIYDHDGSGGSPIYGPFSGAYIVYSVDGNMYLDKVSNYPNYWGTNNPNMEV